MLYQRILKEHQKLHESINRIQNKLKKLPEGNFIVTRNSSRYKWYQSDGHTQTYIPKKNRLLAEQLALRKYLTLLLKDLSHEKNILDFYLRHHTTDLGKSSQLLMKNSEYQKLLSPYFQPLDQELSHWQNSSFQQNTNYPEQLIHKTCSGNFVRSKSEVLIDMLLHNHRIPFRYECALNINGTTFFPDFTIRHPKTGETFYWEHFGIMDDPAYVKKVYSKLEIYAHHGMIPSINLITTYETKEHPLSLEMIETIITYYFL